VIKAIVDAVGRLRRNERGNVAILFGLTLIPVGGAAGMGLDYSRASNYYSSAQSEVDAAVLSVARRAVEINTQDTTKGLPESTKISMIEARAAEAIAIAKAQLTNRYGTSIENITVSGQWINQVDREYRITASGNMQRTLSAIVPGVAKTQEISVGANAKAIVQPSTTSSAPKIDRPGYEAGDYNRVYVYCYDDSKKNEPNKGRSKMTAISSNGTDNGVPETDTNPVFKNIQMPVCTGGETLSWRLYNVRMARTDKTRWPKDTLDPATGLWTQQDNPGENTNGTPQQRSLYNYYTDTKINPTNNAQTYQFEGSQLGYNGAINMIETVVCDTREQCTPGAPGNMVPAGKQRTPQVSNQACAPGKVMYIGWEDRPVIPNRTTSEYNTWGSGYWTDADYDDIRIVVNCPVTTPGSNEVKLTR
jgi:Putative Flp pilus-assembly TadE/G-like